MVPTVFAKVMPIGVPALEMAGVVHCYVALRVAPFWSMSIKAGVAALENIHLRVEDLGVGTLVERPIP